MVYNLLIFSFISHAFGAQPKNSLLVLSLKDFFLCFFLKVSQFYITYLCPRTFCIKCENYVEDHFFFAWGYAIASVSFVEKVSLFPSNCFLTSDKYQLVIAMIRRWFVVIQTHVEAWYPMQMCQVETSLRGIWVIRDPPSQKDKCSFGRINE